jgi:hypothetical protein
MPNKDKVKATRKAGREALAAVGLLGAVMGAGAMSPQWNLNEQQSRPLGPPKATKEGKRTK